MKTHPAQLFIVMASSQEELESFFMAKHSRPGQGSIPSWGRVWIAHIRPLNQAFDKEKIVFYGILEHEQLERQRKGNL